MSGIPLVHHPSWTKLKMSARWLYRGFLRCSLRTSDDVIAWFLSNHVKEEFQNNSQMDWRTAKRCIKHGWPMLKTANSALNGNSPCMKKLILMSYAKEGILADRLRLLQRRAQWRPEAFSESSLQPFHPLLRLSVFAGKSADAKAEYHALLMQRAEKMDRPRLYWSVLQPVAENHFQFLYLPALHSSISPSSSSTPVSPALSQFFKSYCERYSGFPFRNREALPPLMEQKTSAPSGFVYPSLPVIEE